MSAFIISVALLLAAGDQPPADTAVAPAMQATTSTPAAAPAKEEPKMICKYENSTGSRLQKVKICRPANERADDQDTKLQRELNRNGDLRLAPTPGFGN